MNIQIKVDDVTNWIYDKFKKPTCSICGENQWEFSDKLWQFVEYKAPVSSLVIPGVPQNSDRQALVMVFMICMNCKQVHIFNAIAITLQAQKDSPIAKAPPLPPVELLN